MSWCAGGGENRWTVEWEESWEDDVRVAVRAVGGDRGNGPFETWLLRPQSGGMSRYPFGLYMVWRFLYSPSLTPFTPLSPLRFWLSDLQSEGSQMSKVDPTDVPAPSPRELDKVDLHN